LIPDKLADISQGNSPEDLFNTAVHSARSTEEIFSCTIDPLPDLLGRLSDSTDNEDGSFNTVQGDLQRKVSQEYWLEISSHFDVLKKMVVEPKFKLPPSFSPFRQENAEDWLEQFDRTADNFGWEG